MRMMNETNFNSFLIRCKRAGHFETISLHDHHLSANQEKRLDAFLREISTPFIKIVYFTIDAQKLQTNIPGGNSWEEKKWSISKILCHLKLENNRPLFQQTLNRFLSSQYINNIDLSSCLLKNEDMKTIVDCLKKNEAIQYLDLTNNHFTEEGINQLAEVLLSLPSNIIVKVDAPTEKLKRALRRNQMSQEIKEKVFVDSSLDVLLHYYEKNEILSNEHSGSDAIKDHYFDKHFSKKSYQNLSDKTLSTLIDIAYLYPLRPQLLQFAIAAINNHPSFFKKKENEIYFLKSLCLKLYFAENDFCNYEERKRFIDAISSESSKNTCFHGFLVEQGKSILEKSLLSEMKTELKDKLFNPKMLNKKSTELRNFFLKTGLLDENLSPQPSAPPSPENDKIYCKSLYDDIVSPFYDTLSHFNGLSYFSPKAKNHTQYSSLLNTPMFSPQTSSPILIAYRDDIIALLKNLVNRHQTHRLKLDKVKCALNVITVLLSNENASVKKNKLNHFIMQNEDFENNKRFKLFFTESTQGKILKKIASVIDRRESELNPVPPINYTR